MYTKTYEQSLEWDKHLHPLPCSLLHFSSLVHTIDMEYLNSHFPQTMWLYSNLIRSYTANKHYPMTTSNLMLYLQHIWTYDNGHKDKRLKSLFESFFLYILNGFGMEVFNPFSKTFLGRTLVFEWYVIWFGSKERTPKWHLFNGNWNACSIYDNHSRLNNQHNSGRILLSTCDEILS